MMDSGTEFQTPTSKQAMVDLVRGFKSLMVKRGLINPEMKFSVYPNALHPLLTLCVSFLIISFGIEALHMYCLHPLTAMYVQVYSQSEPEQIHCLCLHEVGDISCIVPLWTPDFPYIHARRLLSYIMYLYNHESQDYKEAVRVLEGESVIDGPLFPGYEGPDEDFQASVNALASEVQRRRTEADRLLERTPGAELVAQLRIDAGDALDCLRQSNALTPLLNDAVKKFFVACLSTRSVWVHCFANDGSLKGQFDLTR